jgi:uncharacterized protein YdeI (YjbR/CyaY-like superfamily)
MQKKEIETFCPTSQKDWRQWLENNHNFKQSIWLVYYKKVSKKVTIDWSKAVDEALCFGWIDSKKRPIDKETFMQLFSKRKPNGTWSKVNKEKIQKLIDAKLMTKAGFESINNAKQNGSWTILDEVEKLIIPKDLEEEFNKSLGSLKYFKSLSRSLQKSILHWIVLAKRLETRQKRIKEIVECAKHNDKPKQFI